MVACLMRLSPLPVRARRKDLRRCASIKRLARAAASAPFVAGRNFVEDQTHGKNRIIHRFGGSGGQFWIRPPPSVPFLAMCNLPPGRNNQRREGKVDAATVVSFLLVPRLPNPNSIAGQLTIGVATFFRPLGHSDFGRNAHVVLVLPECTASDVASRRGSLKPYLLAEAETERGAQFFALARRHRDVT